MGMVFPREVGSPARKLVQNSNEYLDFINRNNGKIDCFVSVYTFSRLEDSPRGLKPDYDSAIVDRVFIDFDGKDSFNAVSKMHELLLQDGILHYINFTGRGFHTFAAVNSLNVVNKSTALKNLAEDLCKRSNVSFGANVNGIDFDADSQVFGDLARIRRIEFTYNPKRQAFCYPISEELIKSGEENVREFAKSQQICERQVFGTKQIYLKQFDSPVLTNSVKNDNKISTSVMINSMEFPPCVNSMIEKSFLNYEERFQLILYLMFRGFSLNQTVDFLRQYLHPSKFEKAIIKEKHHEAAYKKVKWNFSQSTMLKYGHCNESLCKQQLKLCKLKEMMKYDGT